MKLEVLKCPSCGANIEFEDGVEYCECEYCGAVITVAPSSSNKNNVIEPLRKFAASTNRPTSTKAKDKNSSEEGIVRKIIKWILNALFIMNILFAGISVIIAIDDGNTDMVFATLFALIYAIMFRVLALTPKGSKYILGKEKGIKPVYFILICVLLSIVMIVASPTTDDSTNTDSKTNIASEQITEST